MGRKIVDLTKEELVNALSVYYSQPKSQIRKIPSALLCEMYETEVYPDVMDSNMEGLLYYGGTDTN